MARHVLHSDKFTKLEKRKLYFDGDSIVNMEFMYDMLLSGKNIDDIIIHPKKINDEVESYNENFGASLTVKKNIKKYDYTWNIPDKYKDIDISTYVYSCLESEIRSDSFSEEQIKVRKQRTEYELELWSESNLTELFKTLIYIIDVFKRDNVVWGTGRGSSCCCYILYLIGLHDVDSIYYDLHLNEFFRGK